MASTIKRQQLQIRLIFLGIPLAWLVVFVVSPIFLIFYLSFTDYNILSPAQMIGTLNYEDLWFDSLFWKATWNTFFYTVVSVPLGIVFSLLLAVLVNRRLPGAALYRSIFYIPVVTPLVAVSVVWILIYQTSNGLANYVLSWINVPPQQWLTSSTLAMPSIIVMSIWKGLGFNMVIFLAALQAIPRELHEAAWVDGAGRFRSFFSITLPLLRPAMIYVVVTSIISSFQVFTQVFVMTEGGPNNATVTLVHLIYRTAFLNLDMGYASAMAMLLFVLLVATSLTSFWLMSRNNYYA
ncbi:carbohydrate ABC transporter permease [Consotaella salsifontis]|uniref:Carbohydrate ABC transporter membrane protein 1, CUT1 family n=1 Tax=Consotaella salsifontis TaxID=1365950 RepID=A0A1T4TA65_9HYPH|nr:sugar ABC transporter permease [Consotaella salsifontis]SKA37374.1 carbohydrate ABC transporter membrane protein 1, CUT1 family [Consotaella salsifontis]